MAGYRLIFSDSALRQLGCRLLLRYIDCPIISNRF